MATKVDRTASMMCRRSGCSSEKLAERVLDLEAALREISHVQFATVEDMQHFAKDALAEKGQRLD